MKSRIILISLILSAALSNLTGQVPQTFNYQALAMDESDNPITEADIKVRIAFLSSIGPDAVLWEEEHIATTNRFGLFSILVGDPKALKTDGSCDSIQEIPWEKTPIYVRTKIEFKAQWYTLGITALASVPYSLLAGRAMEGSDRFSVMGTDLLSGDPLFEVRRKDGIPVFSVYNTGARINVPVFEDTKSGKGGFAIGGFDETKALVQDYLLISPDSVRIYIDDINATKEAKGGFAIGGFDDSKAEADEYLRIMPDCTRIYVRESSKASKGGFAIGSFDELKSTPVEFMNVTPLNYFIGHESGLMNQTGEHNSFLGYQAGMHLTTGTYNVFLGHKSGMNNDAGSYNVYIGNGSGISNTGSYYGTFVGHNSGYYNTGWFNSYLGCNSGFATISGGSNTFIGVNAGRLFEKGSYNTFVGTDAGEGGPGDYYNHGTTDTPSNNTALGFQAGNLIQSGNNNVYLGSYSGAVNESGSGNVFIGHESGRSETASNKLYIANSDTIVPLVYGDFEAFKLGVGTTNLSERLNVDGNVAVSGNISADTVAANITGRVNDMSFGKVFLDGSGPIAFLEAYGLVLIWDSENSRIVINNPSPHQFPYWYRITRGGVTEARSGLIAPEGMQLLIEEVNVDTAGIEIHFGSTNDDTGWCSVWLQYFNKNIVGHYVK